MENKLIANRKNDDRESPEEHPGGTEQEASRAGIETKSGNKTNGVLILEIWVSYLSLAKFKLLMILNGALLCAKNFFAKHS